MQQYCRANNCVSSIASGPEIFLSLSGFGDNWFPRRCESHSPSVWNAMDNVQMTWMSWKCAFQARASAAFRAVWFQLNFQPYVLSRLPPSLAISVRTERATTDCRNCSSVLYTHKNWEMAEGSNYCIIFCLFGLLVCFFLGNFKES